MSWEMFSAVHGRQTATCPVEVQLVDCSTQSDRWQRNCYFVLPVTWIRFTVCFIYKKNIIPLTWLFLCINTYAHQYIPAYTQTCIVKDKILGESTLVTLKYIKCNNAYSVQNHDESLCTNERRARKWQSEKRCDLRRMQTIEREWAAVTCDGRLFHRRAAASGNALSPTVDRRVRRTSRDVDEAERIVVVVCIQCLLVDVVPHTGTLWLASDHVDVCTSKATL